MPLKKNLLTKGLQGIPQNQGLEMLRQEASADSGASQYGAVFRQNIYGTLEAGNVCGIGSGCGKQEQIRDTPFGLFVKYIVAMVLIMEKKLLQACLKMTYWQMVIWVMTEQLLDTMAAILRTILTCRLQPRK